MPKTDPTETGGLFIGRRPGVGGTGRYRVAGAERSRGGRLLDSLLAALLLVLEVALCLSVLGPQPLAWLWLGSQFEYLSGSALAGIVLAVVGTLLSLLVTLAVARRVDHAWKLVRRAAGYRQDRGVLEAVFALSVVAAAIVFCIWFLIIQGPGPQLAPQQ
ncbi:hypothetical protein JDY09_08545 [Thermoleophilum album]|jgi:hypothetical protein|uniref:hypothetical protein n=1 Tax=Thermoleophilum album TaxID=29539 RepID=UPI00237CCD79|nr:hypothetical protein [Thermoleophilum album]WDT93429.1 hypothetical protein JDY09_08545 [Thermoleophilum album]